MSYIKQLESLQRQIDRLETEQEVVEEYSFNNVRIKRTPLSELYKERARLTPLAERERAGGILLEPWERSH